MSLPALHTWQLHTWQLHTARLHIRPVHETDLPALAHINADAEVTRHLPYEPWQPGDAEAWMQATHALHDSGHGVQLVMATHAGRVIGTIKLFRWDAPSQRGELGYVLARASWGQGLMHEALQALCAHCFTHQGVRRLEAQVRPANHASASLLRRCGFHHEGLLRQRWTARGTAYDVDMYAALAHEWLAARRG